MTSKEKIRLLLEQKVLEYNRTYFIENDPISIPHQYSLKQDIEITGFFASILAWGLRKTIILKTKELFRRMDNSPFQFVTQHKENDLKSLLGFKHRTFNDSDLLYFVSFLKEHYQKHDSLEYAFTINLSKEDLTMEEGLKNFHLYFKHLPHFQNRTKKHISTPATKSACKRLNMYLRWMVRKDNQGVDFGIWNQIKPSQLVCPLDVHVERVARRLKLLQRPQTDWLSALELTNNLREFDTQDPVKYDFALFGLGIEGSF
ncbi:MAG: TIGR02757 family protein [Flammeovirgaceae bacterium]